MDGNDSGGGPEQQKGFFSGFGRSNFLQDLGRRLALPWGFYLQICQSLSLKATFQISIFPKKLRFQAKMQVQVSGTGEDKAFVRCHSKEGPEINLCQFCDGSNPYLALLSFILKV